jgi:hypothetical protein
VGIGEGGVNCDGGGVGCAVGGDGSDDALIHILSIDTAEGGRGFKGMRSSQKELVSVTRKLCRALLLSVQQK